MSAHVSSYKMGNDAAFLTKVTRTIFQRYLDIYIKYVAEKEAYLGI